MCQHSATKIMKAITTHADCGQAHLQQDGVLAQLHCARMCRIVKAITTHATADKCACSRMKRLRSCTARAGVRRVLTSITTHAGCRQAHLQQDGVLAQAAPHAPGCAGGASRWAWPRSCWQSPAEGPEALPPPRTAQTARWGGPAAGWEHAGMPAVHAQIFEGDLAPT